MGSSGLLPAGVSGAILWQVGGHPSGWNSQQYFPFYPSRVKLLNQPTCVELLLHLVPACGSVRWEVVGTGSAPLSILCLSLVDLYFPECGHLSPTANTGSEDPLPASWGSISISVVVTVWSDLLGPSFILPLQDVYLGFFLVKHRCLFERLVSWVTSCLLRSSQAAKQTLANTRGSESY